jgi:hypothetical protein
MQNATITIVDVLENALGELSAARALSLSATEIAALSEAVNAFYEPWEPPANNDALRLYAGGWIAGNFQADDARQQLLSSLLYSPQAVIHDPIAEWFFPARERLETPPPIRGRQRGVKVASSEPHLLRGNGYLTFQDQPERTQHELALVLPILAQLAPLIRNGTIIPIPQWQIVQRQQDAILSAVRHDVRDPAFAELVERDWERMPPPRGDHIRGAMLTPPGGPVARDSLRMVSQDPSYYLSKTLMLAEATGSRYVPPAAADVALRDYRLAKLGEELRRKDIDLQVIAALDAAELPFLGDLDAQTIARVHRDEAAFADWRSGLRKAARTIETLPSEGAVFRDEAKEVLADELLPQARQVAKAVARSNVLKNAAKEQSATLGVGAISTIGAAQLLGTPLAPAALVGLGISAIGRAAYASLFGPKPEGAHAVLATLVRRS